jgi:hypothetical protein
MENANFSLVCLCVCVCVCVCVRERERESQDGNSSQETFMASQAVNVTDENMVRGLARELKI